MCVYVCVRACVCGLLRVFKPMCMHVIGPLHLCASPLPCAGVQLGAWGEEGRFLLALTI